MNKEHQEFIAKEGWIFLFPLAALTVIFFIFLPILGWVLVLLTFFVAYFFRNPYRQIPNDPQAIVSPADGKVVAVRQLDNGRQLISIFLNVFNVHINRAPIVGEVTHVQHTPGKFLAAYKEEASKVNERNTLIIQDGSFSVEIVQIAGLIARRIICWAKHGHLLEKGERFGLIRFGSRVDIFLPANCQIEIKPGDKIAGGSDIIARKID